MPLLCSGDRTFVHERFGLLDFRFRALHREPRVEGGAAVPKIAPGFGGGERYRRSLPCQAGGTEKIAPRAAGTENRGVESFGFLALLKGQLEVQAARADREVDGSSRRLLYLEVLRKVSLPYPAPGGHEFQMSVGDADDHDRA